MSCMKGGRREGNTKGASVVGWNDGGIEFSDYYFYALTIYVWGALKSPFVMKQLKVLVCNGKVVLLFGGILIWWTVLLYWEG